MKCEICDTQTATMWVEQPAVIVDEFGIRVVISRSKRVLSCADCGPQLGYKILAPLEPTTTR